MLRAGLDHRRAGADLARSNQLASATFDYFSVFFAPGLMYLVLTGATTGLQLTIERAAESQPDREPPPRQTHGSGQRGHPGARGDVGSAADEQCGAQRRGHQRCRSRRCRLQRYRRRRAVARDAAVRRARVALTVTDVHKSFDDHEVLRGIDLEIRKGEVVALLGPSRCCCSTNRPRRSTWSGSRRYWR